LPPVELRPPERSKQAHQKQCSAYPEKQKVCPRKIARDRKLREKFVTKQSADRDNEAKPQRPVPFPFHAALVRH
jgi:hypothetical protein